MALVLEQFISKVKLEIPDAKFVYDERLSYETAINKFRADNNLKGENTPALPLFAFKRSVLRYSDKGMGRRATGGVVNFFNRTGNTTDVFKVVHGEMDIEFLYIVKSAADSELFEIEYLSETGLPKQKELIVDTTQDLGTDLRYFVDYGPLSDRVMESDNNHFKAISGSVKIVGFYPVFMSTSKVILEIVSKIYGSTILPGSPETLIAENHIVP